MYKKWQELSKSDPSLLDDIEFLWRFAKACMYWGNSMPKKEPKRKDLIYEGLSYATKAYGMNRDHFEALRWTAVLCGATTDYLGIKERINTAKQFKAYLDLALEKEPSEHVLLHLRGRFSYEMASLSWVEKKVCSTIFAKVPERTYDDALTDFLAADKFSPNHWPENKLYIARCYCKKKEKKPAEDYLKEVENGDKIDDAVKEGIQDVQGMIVKIK
uniref:Regulator of microtubule dynamics protein 1 n=1 Tax=Syphacia muris TaxID=451379 RepID=A0A0N5B138_9BILA